jgi:hypothetical protein
VNLKTDCKLFRSAALQLLMGFSLAGSVTAVATITQPAFAERGVPVEALNQPRLEQGQALRECVVGAYTHALNHLNANQPGRFNYLGRMHGYDIEDIQQAATMLVRGCAVLYAQSPYDTEWTSQQAGRTLIGSLDRIAHQGEIMEFVAAGAPGRQQGTIAQPLPQNSARPIAQRPPAVQQSAQRQPRRIGGVISQTDRYMPGYCKDLNARGYGNFPKGDPSYRPDRDRNNDGYACDFPRR